MSFELAQKTKALKANYKKLSPAKKQLLQENFKNLQRSPDFTNNFPYLIRTAISETMESQNLSKLTQEDFFKTCADRYAGKLEGSVADNYSSYLHQNKRPIPNTMHKLLQYFYEEAVNNHPISIGSNYNYSDTISFDYPSLSRSKYNYSDTIFPRPIDLINYFEKAMLYSIEAMLLLNQQKYWLKWNKIDNRLISFPETRLMSTVNSTFLEVNAHINEVAYAKVRLISDMNNAEFYFYHANPNWVAEKVHQFVYTEFFEDPIVTMEKHSYSLAELQSLFKQYYPYVSAILENWKNNPNRDLYDSTCKQLSYRFDRLCRWSPEDQKIDEKKFVFTFIADDLRELIWNEVLKAFNVGPSNPLPLSRSEYVF